MPPLNRPGKGSAPTAAELAQLADDPVFRERLSREFPRIAGLFEADVDRRTALKLLAAPLALMGLGGCGERQPPESIVGYVEQPEHLVPGVPRFYATALTPARYAEGVLVETHMGRPTRIEGNALHPASLGAIGIQAQVEILTLYDPARSRTVLHDGHITSRTDLDAHLARRRDAWQASGGRGLAILTEPIVSPSLAAEIETLRAQYPELRWYLHDPLEVPGPRAGARLAFGRPLDSLYDLDPARVILSLDADFLGVMPGNLRHARAFAKGRALSAAPYTMNRLYALESAPGLAGAAADHRLGLPARHMDAVARALARRLGLNVPGPQPPVPDPWLDAAARDLAQAGRRALVLCGGHLEPGTQALVQAINQRLGAFGTTLRHIEPVAARPDDEAGLAALTAAMAAGEVESLIVFGTNPLYDAPADLGFTEAVDRVPEVVHYGLYADETAARAHWHVPMAHVLERWGDVRAFDGTVSLQQPMTRPLYTDRDDGGGLSPYNLLAALRGARPDSPRELLRRYWQDRREGDEDDFEVFWHEALAAGVVPGTAAQPVQAELRADLIERLPPPATEPPAGLEIRFQPDPCVGAGQLANNAYAQELPKPLSDLVWGNAALIGPKTAAELGLANKDLARLRLHGRSLEAPVHVLPMQPEGVVTLHLGYGRERAGPVGDGVGVSAYRLRRTDHPWVDHGLEVERIGHDPDAIVTLQEHHQMHGREPVRTLDLDALQAGEAIEERYRGEPPSLYPEHLDQGRYAWGMIIDLTACIGCQACVAACQGENNIPVVGREQVALGRDMFWLRVDRYDSGERTLFQPVPCMQCEQAPCEYVCPVGATLHGRGGLNDMVYNRCVGTRYCSQNCPYKVRRFNFLEYTGPDGVGPTLPAAAFNPDVTVRTRGVMEKCTYCTQRISRARRAAREENRPIRDGEVVTACQAACPTQAIVFGDLRDPQSVITQIKGGPLEYVLLKELGTRPRTTYLARVRNADAALSGPPPEDETA